MKKFCKNALYFLIPLSLLVCYFCYLDSHGEELINSDSAGELMLGKLLAQEGGIISQNWYYSADIRVLNTNLIFAPLFCLSSDYHTVRVWGYTILLALLVAGGAFLGKSMGLNKASNCFFCSLLLLPFCKDYQIYVLQGMMYMPYILISFITIGSLFILLKIKPGRGRNLLFLGLAILALLATLSGPRQILVLYAPLFVGSGLLLADKFRFDQADPVPEVAGLKNLCFKLSSILLASSFIGWLINVFYLGKRYHFPVNQPIEFVGFSEGNFWKTLNSYLATLGYSTGPLFSKVLLLNIAVAFIVLSLFAIIIQSLKRTTPFEIRFLSYFLATSYTVFLLFYSFTNFDRASTGWVPPRYNLPFSTIVFPLLLLHYQNWLTQSSEKVKLCRKWVCCGAVLLYSLVVVINGLGVKDHSTVQSDPVELKKISEVLVNGGYKNGYATFWHGDVLTVLSNGKLELYVWQDNLVGGLDHLSTWLQLTEHTAVPPSGKLFCLLSNKELLNPASERRNWAEVFKNAPIIYQSQAYTAYSFKNYAEMLGLASEYSFDLGNTDYYSEGNITQNRTAKRILGPGASSLGPLITMYPGRYKITCRGQNLDILTFDTVSERTGGPRMKIIGKEKVTKTPELIEYTIDISETLTQVETIFFNGSQGTAVMESLDIKKAD